MSQRQVLMKMADDLLDQVLTDVISEVAKSVVEHGEADDVNESDTGAGKAVTEDAAAIVQSGAAASTAGVSDLAASSLFSGQDSEGSDQDSSPSKRVDASISDRSFKKLDASSTSYSSCSPDLKVDKGAGSSRRESSWSPPRVKNREAAAKLSRHSSSSPRRLQTPRGSIHTRQSSSSPTPKVLPPNPTKRRKSDVKIQDSDTTEDEMRANASLDLMVTPNSLFFLLIHCDEMSIHNCHHLQAILEGVGDYKGREGYDEKGLYYELAFDTRATMMTWLGHLKFLGFGDKTNQMRSRLTFTEGRSSQLPGDPVPKNPAPGTKTNRGGGGRGGKGPGRPRLQR